MNLAPVVQAFVQQHAIGADAVRPDGRVLLTVDRRYRLQLLSAAHAQVAIQADLLALPPGVDRRIDDLLMKLAGLAAGMLQRHAGTLCIDPRSQCLVLQQCLPRSCDLNGLEQALADFTNALVFWHRVCAQPSPSLEGLRA